MKTPKIPERWLYWAYQDPQWLPDRLTATDGREIVLMERGCRNFADGPDFSGAQVRIDGLLCRGDIEFHVRRQDWHHHGHHNDRRYEQVILHCFWEAEKGPDPELAARFPQVCLSQFLKKPLAEWTAAMQTLEGSLQSAPGNPAIPTAAEIAEYSQDRFYRRCDKYLEHLRCISAGDLCNAALAEALGYRLNQKTMFNLVLQLPGNRFADKCPAGNNQLLQTYASLLIYSGLCPPPRNDGSLLMTAIAERLAAGDMPLFQIGNWRFGKVRPANQPIPRLAALAQMLSGENGRLFRQLQQELVSRQPLSILLSRIERLLRRPLAPVLQSAVGRLQGSLPTGFTMGRRRIRQFMVSGLLPLMWAIAVRRKQFGFQLYLESLYEAFPASESAAVIDNCLPAATPATLRQLIRKSAFYQQGVLEFYALRQRGALLLPAY